MLQPTEQLSISSNATLEVQTKYAFCFISLFILLFTFTFLSPFLLFLFLSCPLCLISLAGVQLSKSTMDHQFTNLVYQQCGMLPLLLLLFNSGEGDGSGERRARLFCSFFLFILLFILLLIYHLQLDNQCIDLYDFTGPIVQTYACNGGTNQKWIYDPVKKTFSADSICLDVGSSGNLEVRERGGVRLKSEREGREGEVS